MRVLVVAALFLLVGCAKPDPEPPLPTETVVGEDTFLEDPLDEDVQGIYDLRRATFKELNGSLVLSIEMRDVGSQIPRLVNVFDILVEGQRDTYYVATVPDPNRPPSYIAYELGHIVEGRQEPIGRVCGIHGEAETPPRIIYDLPHKMTGLEEGGSIVRLHVEVHNFEDETLYDAGDAEKSFAVRGGPNPHDTCALFAERANQS